MVIVLQTGVDTKSELEEQEYFTMLQPPYNGVSPIEMPSRG